MAEKKISDLTGKENINNDDELVFVDKATTSGTDAGVGGQTSKIKFSDFKNAVGTSGPQGSQGPQGHQGHQGNTGVGQQGKQGNTGTGQQGKQGHQGHQGHQGNTGVGQQGKQGHQGAKGSQGSVGTGVQGRQGAQGSQGSSGLNSYQTTGYHQLTSTDKSNYYKVTHNLGTKNVSVTIQWTNGALTEYVNINHFYKDSFNNVMIGAIAYDIQPNDLKIKLGSRAFEPQFFPGYDLPSGNSDAGNGVWTRIKVIVTKLT